MRRIERNREKENTAKAASQKGRGELRIAEDDSASNEEVAALEMEATHDVRFRFPRRQSGLAAEVCLLTYLICNAC